ncbi:MAG: hypothetical protein AAF602_20005 [Myxococcota bacterium]
MNLLRLVALCCLLPACPSPEEPGEPDPPSSPTDTPGTPDDTARTPTPTGTTGATGDTGGTGLADLTLDRCLDDDGCDLPFLIALGQTTCANAVTSVGGDGSAARGIWTESGGFSRSIDSEFAWACVSDDLTADHCITICPETGFSAGELVPGFGCRCTETQPAVGAAADEVRAPACDGPASDADITVSRQQVGSKDLYITAVQVVCVNGSEPISEENCRSARARADLQFGTSLTRSVLTGVGCYLSDSVSGP